MSGLARAKELPCQIGVQDVAPLLQCHVGDWRIPLDTGVGNKDVEPTKFIDEGSVHRSDLLLVGHVRPEGEHRISSTITSAGWGICVEVDADRGARARKRAGHRSADPGTRARDERALPAQRLVFGRHAALLHSAIRCSGRRRPILLRLAQGMPLEGLTASMLKIADRMPANSRMPMIKVPTGR